MPKRITAVVLAAGSSRRFGRTKQLAMIDGLTMVERAIRMLGRTKVDGTLVVLGDRADEVGEGLKGTRFGTITNRAFRDGLSSSLKAGVKAAFRESDAAVIVLADQPLVTAELIDELISRYLETGCEIVTSSAGGRVSPPVVLDRSLRREIDELEGDSGAKRLIETGSSVERVEVEPETLLDVDTEDDLRRARRILRSSRREARARGGGGRGRAPPSS